MLALFDSEKYFIIPRPIICVVTNFISNDSSDTIGPFQIFPKLSMKFRIYTTLLNGHCKDT